MLQSDLFRNQSYLRKVQSSPTNVRAHHPCSNKQSQFPRSHSDWLKLTHGRGQSFDSFSLRLDPAIEDSGKFSLHTRLYEMSLGVSQL